MDTTIFAHGNTHNNQTTEWWHIFKNGAWKFVEISYDAAWFSREGTIADLKRMACDAHDRAASTY